MISRSLGILVVALSLAACETIDGMIDEPSEPVTTVSQEKLDHTLDLAQRAMDEGRYGDAQRLLERVLHDDPDNPEAKLSAAELTMARGNLENSAELFQQQTEDPAVSARAYQGLGLSLLLDDQRRKAHPALLTAVELDPTLWRAWNGLGFYYDLEADWPAAEQSYLRAIDINPDSSFVYNNLGYSLVMQGRYEEAINQLSQALSLEPNLETAQTNLRLALAWKGKYALATTGVTEEDKGKVYNNIGFVALMRRDYESAETYLLRAMEADASFNQTARKNLALLRNLQDINEDETEDPPAALLPSP